MKGSALGFALALVLSAGCTEKDEAPVITYYPAGADIAGQTCEELAGQWWSWALSIPASTSPLHGGDCTQNQSGDVFFLAGNSGGTESRTCTVPAQASIFFPILNMFPSACPEVFGAESECPLATDEGLLAGMAGFDQNPIEMEVVLNGRPMDENLLDFLCTSAPFDMVYTAGEPSITWVAQNARGGGMPATDVECAAPWEAGNACGMDPGPRRTATTGFWVALEPLSPGRHTVRFRAVVNPDDPWFALDVTYELIVTE